MKHEKLLTLACAIWRKTLIVIENRKVSSFFQNKNGPRWSYLVSLRSESRDMIGYLVHSVFFLILLFRVDQSLDQSLLLWHLAGLDPRLFHVSSFVREKDKKKIL